MADSTTNIPQFTFGLADKETQLNELFDAASPAMTFGRNGLTTTGLTWGYIGGRHNSISIPNGTIALTASTTNYLEAVEATGVVVKNTTGWTGSGYKKLYQVVTGTSGVTSYTDRREPSVGATGADGKTVRHGTGAPDNSLGNDGDFYISDDTHYLYGPKASGAWPAGTSIVGPQGIPGDPGPPGTTDYNGLTNKPTLASLMRESTETYSSTINLDCSAHDSFHVVLTGNPTINFVSGANDFQVIAVRLKQDGVGNRTITFGSMVRFGADIPANTFALSTAAGKTDYLGLRYNAIDNKYDVVAFNKGF